MVNALYVFALTASLAVFANAALPRGFYCKLSTCKGPNHTICKYPYLKTNSRCGTVKSSTLTAGEINDLLISHNKHRAVVASGNEKRGSNGEQPAASNLKPLEWDKELADIAQTWANQCDYGHDKCRDVEKYRVGQNVAYKGTTGPFTANITELVDMWYDEVALFDKDLIKSVHTFDTPKGTVGHYTQMMWANTTHVGCGAVRYNPDGKWNKTYLVCNYGPSGNWKNQEMYKIKEKSG